MSSPDRVSIPLLSQLIPEGLRPGTIFAVEFDPDSQWLALTATIAAKYLQIGQRVTYVTSTRPPESVKDHLANLGVNVPDLPEAHASLSALFFDQDDMPGAEAEARTALELNPTQLNPWTGSPTADALAPLSEGKNRPTISGTVEETQKAAGSNEIEVVCRLCVL